MSTYDFNNAERQNKFELIPAGTVVRLSMAVRSGGAGPDNMFTESKASDFLYLRSEFTVVEGPYVRRKIFQNIGFSGGKTDERGNSIGGNMGRTMLRAIIESSRGIHPDDQSDKARQARCLEGGYDSFNGMVFLAKLKVEKGQAGYEDKNVIGMVITPDMKEYQQAGPSTVQATVTAYPTAQPAPAPSWTNPAPPPAQKSPIPAWAR